jgi:hypothetical protein
LTAATELKTEARRRGRAKRELCKCDQALAFPETATWVSQPAQPLVSGSDIIDNTRALERDFVPLLPG